MSFATRDTWGRPVEMDTDHGHVTLRVGHETAELDADGALDVRLALIGAETTARRHRCGDCGEDAIR